MTQSYRLLLLSFLLASPAYANMRAPRIIPSSPSSALKATGAELIVTGESLTFTCAADACKVSATYRVISARELQANLEFILPVQSDVSVTTGATRAAVNVVSALPLKQDEAVTQKLFESQNTPLFRANFTSTFLPGDNVITVEYLQPLGAREADYGYFKKSGRMVQRFRYELWPLREWTRAPDFRIAIAVSMERPARGWWKRGFGTSRSVTCQSSARLESPVVGKIEQRGAHLWYETELGPSIPDQMTCYLGDEDLLPGESLRMR